MPFAIVQGEPLTELPRDLYISPDALEVILESFEGPLDLWLYLIKRQNLDIPVAGITRQYMSYIGMMEVLCLELAEEYLLMAAMLAEIKSHMLLPRPVEFDDEDDSRAELVRRLQEYERYKQATGDIDALPRSSASFRELMSAFARVMARAEMLRQHQIAREPLSVRGRMSQVLSRINADIFNDFSALFSPEEGRADAVVTLLALLELEIGYFTVLERDGAVIACAALYPYAEEGAGELGLLWSLTRTTAARVSVMPCSRRCGAKPLLQGLRQLLVLSTQTAHWFIKRGFSEVSVEQLPM